MDEIKKELTKLLPESGPDALPLVEAMRLLLEGQQKAALEQLRLARARAKLLYGPLGWTSHPERVWPYHIGGDEYAADYNGKRYTVHLEE